MSTQAQHLAQLLEQINGGDAAGALPGIEALLRQQPASTAALALHAEALRLLGRLPEAVEAYRRAGEHGAGARNWLIAGMLLAGERKTDEALQCLEKARAESPDDEQVLDTLVTTLFNANRQREALPFARHQLAVGRQPHHLANAALLLQSTDHYEEANDAFRRIIALAPDDPAMIGAALGPARFSCDWDWIESLQQRIRSWYDAGDFAAPREYPLTHVTWCTDEACNLGVTRAYGQRTVPAVTALATRTTALTDRRIRVGYLSCDFRNHATMHLMAGLLEQHDRARFEIFAYDYSAHDISDYRQRFLDAVEHVVPIHSLSDREAAARIAADGLDILFDLKVYTGGCRPGILAYRPAPLQAAWLGFPGSAANADIDYIVSDRFVTPERSAPFYTEKFCRLPHTYQCNDRNRQAAANPGTRAQHGLPEGRIVFGAFNQSYKIERASFGVWLRILATVPDSVLWLLGQNTTAVEHLTRQAGAAGIGPERLIFAPFADPRDHLARLQLADAVLDTLVCNGHTTTSDALWAGVPVITARGQHFASRVSESLLNAIGLPELVGVDHDDMVRIAARLGTDAQWRTALRQRAGQNRLAMPLFDTARFTRDFESAIESMIAQSRSGAGLQAIDVPDQGPVQPQTTAAAPLTPSATLRSAFAACPLCGGGGVTLGHADGGAHALWHEPLPRQIEWLRCAACGHVHTRHHWSDAGLAEVLRAPAALRAVDCGGEPARRMAWAPVVERAVALLGGYPVIATAATPPLWVDVGCGDGSLVQVAADHGFAAVGLDRRPGGVQRLQALGYTGLQHDFLQLDFEVVPDVLSLMDVLEEIPSPPEALRKAARVLRPGGLLILSSAALGSSAWRAMEAERTNPCWADLLRHHHFDRALLIRLLRDTGFEVVGFCTPQRTPAQMELYARRSSQ